MPIDHFLCLNTNSFPAQNEQEAYDLLIEALQGILHLNTGEDRFTLYIDLPNDDLDDFLIAPNYTYQNFKDELLEKGEQDLLGFLLSVKDFSPALDHVEEEVFEEVASYSFYIVDQGVEPNNDIFGLCWFLPATLLSIKTAQRWNQETVPIARTDSSGSYIDEDLSIKNISCIDHGKAHKTELLSANETLLEDICDRAIFSDTITNWHRHQTEENKRRIIDKISHACQKNFQGGEPLFKSLEDGYREVRFRAYPSGAIRIIFKTKPDGRHAILNGWIKKNNTEGYKQAKSEAKKIFEKL